MAWRRVSAPSGEAPQEGRQQTCINWLLKQLKDERVPADLVVKVDWDRKNLRTIGKAGELRVNASGLMFYGHHQPVPADALPRRSLLEWTRKLDKPKGKSTTSVLKGISDDLEAFYGAVVERLVGYVAPAPKLPKEHVAGSAAGAAIVDEPAVTAIELPAVVECDSSPAQLDAALQDTQPVGSNEVLAASAPDESSQ